MTVSVDCLKIGVIGLGYVGLPLATEFGKIQSVIGFDTNETRINQLRGGVDVTNEASVEDLKASTHLSFSNNVEDLRDCNCYIITVPTPIDTSKKPDLRPIQLASSMIGQILKKDDLVIYESTVYPGCTEEYCVPILESKSGLKYNSEFFCGYSPERINPGDKERRIANIVKVTSGSNPEIAEIVDRLYRKIIKAGTHKAENIKIAEAAKIIENTQRDVNIALINELAVLFDRLNIDTQSVLHAAGTKWNFLNFKPGLVGGHCIGVDPYYLTHKALAVGHNPEIIIAGRRTNDGMAKFVANKLIKAMLNRDIKVNGANILILGFTFKENCPDTRNTKVIDVVTELLEYKCNVDVYDPVADKDEVYNAYQLQLIDKVKERHYDAILLAVAHDEFKLNSPDWYLRIKTTDSIIFDLKHILPIEITDIRL